MPHRSTTKFLGGWSRRLPKPAPTEWKDFSPHADDLPVIAYAKPTPNLRQLARKFPKKSCCRVLPPTPLAATCSKPAPTHGKNFRENFCPQSSRAFEEQNDIRLSCIQQTYSNLLSIFSGVSCPGPPASANSEKVFLPHPARTPEKISARGSTSDIEARSSEALRSACWPHRHTPNIRQQALRLPKEFSPGFGTGL